jgi:cellulose synthase/poly-beta-1,6-N-acetylglucosamine synthase-like glycosyltransferase
MRLLGYGVVATALHIALLVLIIQRRDLSWLDQLVFWYLMLHLVVDALRLLAGIAILLWRGFPRLATIAEHDWPGLTVVIPCHNEAEVIAATIGSLQAVDYPNLRILVVDDGSSDATAAIACSMATASVTTASRTTSLGASRPGETPSGATPSIASPIGTAGHMLLDLSMNTATDAAEDSRLNTPNSAAHASIPAAPGGPELRVLRQPAAGKAAALNAGIAAVTTPLTLLVDADCLLPRQGLRNAVRQLEGEAEDALGGHLSVLNRDTWLTHLQHLEYGDMALRHWLWRFDLNLSHTQDVIPGALGLFRSEALRAAGPLSTSHLAEDVALTARLLEQGRRLAFSPFLQAATVVPDSLPSLRIQRRRWVRGYTQVALQQLRRLPALNARARMAALAMAIKTVRWPLDFALALTYGLHAWSQGQPVVLLLSLPAMLFPFSLTGLSRFLRSDGHTLLLFTYGYGMLLLGWRVWDQLTMASAERLRWEPYRRRRSQAAG